jgi:hypothetical protein
MSDAPAATNSVRAAIEASPGDASSRRNWIVWWLIDYFHARELSPLEADIVANMSTNFG